MGAVIIIVLVAIIVIVVLVLASGIRVVNQYERGVVFILGRLIGPRGPGIFYIPPVISRMVKVDLRIVTIEVPPQEVITRDNVTVRVSAVVYFYVVQPNDAVNQVVDFYRSTVQIAQTTLRNVLGQSELDELLAERERINQRLQTIIDEHTSRWGVKVTAVEIQDVELPQSMQRAMARQAEAEREKRAKVLHAQGELQASQIRTKIHAHRIAEDFQVTAVRNPGANSASVIAAKRHPGDPVPRVGHGMNRLGD